MTNNKMSEILIAISTTGRLKFELNQVRDDQSSPADTIGSAARKFRDADRQLKEMVEKAVDQVVDGLTLAASQTVSDVHCDHCGDTKTIPMVAFSDGLEPISQSGEQPCPFCSHEGGYIGILEAFLSVAMIGVVIFLTGCFFAIMGSSGSAWAMMIALLTGVAMIVRRGERKKARRLPVPRSGVVACTGPGCTLCAMHEPDSLDNPWEEDE